MEFVVQKAYAKINLWLDCLYKREDNYHEIVSLMQKINLYDVVKLKKAKGIYLETNNPFLPTDERNLALKAALLLQEKFPEKIEGFQIEIEKNIPVEAGLAGGSTDAASVFMLMNDLFDLGLDKGELEDLGQELGSDIPFFFNSSTSLVTGRGELVRPLKVMEKMHLVLLKPKFGLSTKEVYENLDLKKRSREYIQPYLKALRDNNKNFLINKTYNILEKTSFSLYPELGTIKKELEKMSKNPVFMSGSGPSLLVLFEDKEDAEELFRRIPKSMGEKFLTTTVDD